MITAVSAAFSQMDALSQAGEPFFFLVDYEMENAQVFKPKNLVDEGIWVAFPGFSNFPKPPRALPSFAFQSFPESLEEYARGFDFIQKNQRAGNCYLANYTRQTRIITNYSLAEIFQASQTKYKV